MGILPILNEDKLMTDNIENSVLEHLKAIRAEMAGIRNDMDDLKLRMGSIEEHVAGMRRDMSILHGDIVITHKRLDHHEE